MKYHIKYALLCSIAFIALYSCTSMRKIVIQVAVPQNNPISPDVQSIAILNRSFSRSSFDMQFDSIEYSWVKDNLNFEKVYSDTIAADTVLNVVAKAIYDYQCLDVVVPLQRNILRDDEGGVVAPLDTAFINELCKDFNVDGILVLENFSERINRKVKVLPSSSKAVYTGTIDLTYNSNWRFYQPKQKIMC